MPRFVVEYEGDTGDAVVRVWAWDDWVRTPINTRTWNIVIAHARDELDAYTQAIQTQEEQNNDR